VTNQPQLDIDIRRDLCRLARFGANISDSHSCFIFVPPCFLDPITSSESEAEYLDLGGYHSLSPDILEPCRLTRGIGIIGWVAKHRQSIHVSPFEHDSRTLGTYTSDQKLKSFIGIPIALQLPGGTCCAGVVGCDSKKSYAFSKLQGKLLEDLAFEISNTLKLALLQLRRDDREASWQQFLARGETLLEALGHNAVEVLRVRTGNFTQLEAALGTGDCIAMVDQVLRFIQQALPPHFPAYRMPNGDIILVVDNMMSSYYENKISALANHVTRKSHKLQFQFSRKAGGGKQSRTSLENLVAATAVMHSPTIQLTQTIGLEACYEYRRA
jgi:hypothetical protein